MAGIVIIPILVYCALAFYILKIVKNKLSGSNWLVQNSIRAALAALLLGPGIISFGTVFPIVLPAPTIVVPWFVAPKDLLFGAIVPFVIWWVLAFAILVIKMYTDKAPIQDADFDFEQQVINE